MTVILCDDCSLLLKDFIFITVAIKLIDTRGMASLVLYSLSGFFHIDWLSSLVALITTYKILSTIAFITRQYIYSLYNKYNNITHPAIRGKLSARYSY